MSRSSHQQPPGGARGAGQPSTQEIPVAAPAGQPAPARPATGGAHLPPPGAAAPPHAAPSKTAQPQAAPPKTAPPVPMQPTGPVDLASGPPGAGALPSRPPAATGTQAAPTAAWPDSLEQDRARSPRRTVGSRKLDRRAALGLGLAVVAVGLLEVGLLLRFGDVSFWSTVTLWSAFATLSAVIALLAFAAFYPAGNRLKSGAIWRIAAAGLVGLSVFWVLVVLPVVASDRGFVLTAALGVLGAALWVGPRRKG